MIEDAVDSAYQKLLTKFDIVEKPKPVRKAAKKEVKVKPIEQVVVENVDAFNNLLETGGKYK
ncbi:hypothetical protein D3C85_1932440 [compost metagenome]